jgi:hypothetical protein
MSEEENQSVEDQNPEGVAQPTESEEHNDVSNEVEETEQSKRNDAEYNWAEMRREMRKKDQQIEELQTQFSNISQRKPTQDEEDELAKLAEDDILTVAQARKLAQKMARNVAEDVIKERDAANVEERAHLKYPDWSEVVNEETINLLKQKRPRTAKALSKMDDPYEQALEAYELIRDLEIKTKSPNVDKKLAQENSKKPLSVQAVSKTSALADLNVFAQMDAQGKKNFYKQKYAEMQSAIKGA